MGLTDDELEDRFASIYEPFAGLEEGDYDLHGIYMDHEPETEYVTSLDKCKDNFLNILLSDDNLRNASLCEEIKANIFGGENCQTEEEDEQPAETKYRTHDPNTRWYKMVPRVGDMFETVEQLKHCIANYAIANGYRIYFEKCDTKRLVARCGKRGEEKACPYRLHAAWMFNERTFQIRSLLDAHECSRDFKNFGSILSPEWLGRQYMREIANKPKIKLKEMIADIKLKYRVTVTIGQCRRAKKWARNLIEGKLGDHYGRIWDYANELIVSNPGTICKVGVVGNPDGKNYFQRFYTCFQVLKDEWKKGCRKVIGLDGCFLKGEVKGELLTAIGRDANNQVYPIAWTVVDVENLSNWSWFVEHIKADLELGEGNGHVVISDQHKGLVEAVKAFLPQVEHRQCARHIYANFRKSYAGLEFKKYFWAASMSCVVNDFNKNMEEMKKISPGAYDYLMGKEPHTWSRAFYKTGFACEAVENGMSECFNAIIVEARKKPLITMLEEIRLYIMERFGHMNQDCTKWKTTVCPGVLKKMRVFGKKKMLWEIFHSQGDVFEARRGCYNYRVDLEKHTCSCRIWDLSGIPYVHAQAACEFMNKPPDRYVDHVFSIDKFKECYLGNIAPVSGSNMWVQTNYKKPLPPVARRLPGRPKTKRIRHATEKESKFGAARVKSSRTVRCSNCLEYGHNSQSCKNDKRVEPPVPKKKTGRPRKHPLPTEGQNPSEGQNPPVPHKRQRKGQSSSDPLQDSGSRSKLRVRRGGGRGGRRGGGRGGRKGPSANEEKGPSDFEEGLMDIVVEQAVNDAGDGVEVEEVEEAVNDGVDGVEVEEVLEGVDVEDGINEIGQALSKSLADVEDGINEILGTQMDEEMVEPEFNEGDSSNVLAAKVFVDHETIADLLASGYSMAEIEGMPGIQVELDDTPPVEMDIEEPYVDVANEVEDPDEGRDVGEVHAAAAFTRATQQTVRVRRPSERIMLQKLKKPVFGKNGEGCSSSNPYTLP